MEWVIVLAALVGCGYWAGDIARRKNRAPHLFYLLGFLLPVLGVVIAALVPPAVPASGPEVVTVACPRCTGIQRAEAHARTFRCRQCGTISPVGPFVV